MTLEKLRANLADESHSANKNSKLLECVSVDYIEEQI